ncbi:hypothetical protein SAMN06297144_1913 [Sphingomonas guangdongensis]|uniref:Uncharacterized protein n=1 Tax=Sphingomonas guangdongensis TaxID=1141890 RepID=A0A285QY13_9SPHN|nr:hypothetical protein [Sphingomonas guangdongensis]SOB86803.1 hypothetical protein SAMN06297144_1913 [Sphingomonas guangdongensis]
MIAAVLLGLAMPAPLPGAVQSAEVTELRATTARVLARPEQATPWEMAQASQALWSEGRRLQAAFWFYVFQQRSRAHADVDTGGDGAAAVRASLNAALGEEINPWLGSDVAAWREVATRAMSFEAKLPIGPAPAGVSAAAWRAAVAKARADYRAGYEATLGKADPAEIEGTRRENGLPVGPLDQPGPALPAEWR